MRVFTIRTHQLPSIDQIRSGRSLFELQLTLPLPKRGKPQVVQTFRCSCNSSRSCSGDASYSLSAMLCCCGLDWFCVRKNHVIVLRCAMEFSTKSGKNETRAYVIRLKKIYRMQLFLRAATTTWRSAAKSAVRRVAGLQCRVMRYL